MKKYILLIMILFISLPGICDTSLSTARQSEIIASINKVSSGMKSMTCDFVQTKYLSMLSNKMVSEGNMNFKNPDKFRWEYTKPYQYLFIFNGTKVYVGNKSKNDVIDINRNKMFKEIARIMMYTVTGKALSSTNDFTTIIQDSGSFWKVSLTPKKKELKSMFSKVELMFGKSNYMISEINIYEKNNDRTNIKLKNIRTNNAVNEKLFAFP